MKTVLAAVVAVVSSTAMANDLDPAAAAFMAENGISFDSQGHAVFASGFGVEDAVMGGLFELPADLGQFNFDQEAAMAADLAASQAVIENHSKHSLEVPGAFDFQLDQSTLTPVLSDSEITQVLVDGGQLWTDESTTGFENDPANFTVGE